MMTDSQLRIAEKILIALNENGNVCDKATLERLFKDHLEECENSEMAKNEVNFVTTCLQQDFKLIRKVTGEWADMPTVLTGLTLEGSKALKKGLKKYISSLEKERNRDLIIKYVYFAGMIITMAISIFTFLKN